MKGNSLSDVRSRTRPAVGTLVATSAAMLLLAGVGRLDAQSSPSMTVSDLSVRTALGGLTTPIGLAFVSELEVARDREEHGTGASGGERSRRRDGARPRGQQHLGAGSARNRTASRLRDEQLRLPLLELPGPRSHGRSLPTDSDGVRRDTPSSAPTRTPTFSRRPCSATGSTVSSGTARRTRSPSIST